MLAEGIGQMGRWIAA